jgi:hypothetical protein
MLRRMPSTLLSEWMAFFDLEPWGYREEEFRAARLCQVVAEPNRDKKQQRTPFQLYDFVSPGLQAEIGERPTPKGGSLLDKMRAMAGEINQGHQEATAAQERRRAALDAKAAKPTITVRREARTGPQGPAKR